MMSHAESSLKMASWNANSLLNHIHEFYYFLSENSIDICTVQETCLNSKSLIPSHPDFQWHIMNRQTLDQSEVRRAGGVAIVIRRSVRQKLLRIPHTQLLECIGVKLLDGNQRIDVFSVYPPERADSNDKRNLYRTDI